jgi:repressor LexA
LSLTTRQTETLDVILGFIARKGYSPSLSEIAEEMGVAVSAVHGSLTRLRRAGMVTWDPNRARTLRLTDVDERELDQRRKQR